MKIKTITCHNVYNAGASLQAYALVNYLKKLGHDVEIIDYVPEYLKHYGLTGVGNSKYDKPVLREIYQLLKLPGRVKARYGRRKAEFDKFTKKYLPLTLVHYSSAQELCTMPPDADVIFAGSDQIWNTLFPNGKDPAFYLQFAKEKTVRASYAASFAVEAIDTESQDNVKKWLSDLNYISVREKSGLDILSKMGIFNGIQILDPVFLLSAEEWKQLAIKRSFVDKYIFLYDFDCNEEIIKYVKCLSKKNGWKIYSFFKNEHADRSFEKEGPEVFLSLIKDAQMIVSNSFHATAFSVIFEKQFVVFERTEKINTRMRDLLECLNLSNRLILNVGNILDEQLIDYTNINEVLSRECAKAKGFISQVLEEAKNRNEKESLICD